MKPQNSVIDYIAQSLRDNWEREALTDFKGQSFQYRAVARKIAKLHIAFEAGGIKKGDRIGQALFIPYVLLILNNNNQFKIKIFNYHICSILRTIKFNIVSYI